jgi:hypothetical protein
VEKQKPKVLSSNNVLELNHTTKKSIDMKNALVCAVVGFLLALKPFAQMQYSLTGSSSTYATVTGGNVPFLLGNGSDPIADEGYANNIPIGFNFYYNGGSTAITEVSVSTNGFISLGSLSAPYVQNNLTSGAVGERPIIAPLWDDMNLQSTNNLVYKTNGTAPNRVFVVEWQNARWGFGATAASISFQVKLYEGLNWIEFNYKQESGTPNAPTASIGLTASNTGSGNFISLLSTNVTPGVSTVSEINNLSTRPATNQAYLFKPGTLPVSITSFAVSKSNGSHIVSWQTLTEINNAGFDIQRSADGRNFSSIQFVSSKYASGNSATKTSYSIVDSKPIEGINYYRLKQVDKDGKEQYSGIISIKNMQQTDWATLTIYPNPVKEKLSIQLNLQQQESVAITISNAWGGKVMQTTKQLGSGATQLYQDVAHLPAGMYVVEVRSSQNPHSVVKSFVK